MLFNLVASKPKSPNVLEISKNPLRTLVITVVSPNNGTLISKFGHKFLENASKCLIFMHSFRYEIQYRCQIFTQMLNSIYTKQCSRNSVSNKCQNVTAKKCCVSLQNSINNWSLNITSIRPRRFPSGKNKKYLKIKIESKIQLWIANQTSETDFCRHGNTKFLA